MKYSIGIIMTSIGITGMIFLCIMHANVPPANKFTILTSRWWYVNVVITNCFRCPQVARESVTAGLKMRKYQRNPYMTSWINSSALRNYIITDVCLLKNVTCTCTGRGKKRLLIVIKEVEERPNTVLHFNNTNPAKASPLQTLCQPWSKLCIRASERTWPQRCMLIVYSVMRQGEIEVTWM